MRKEEIGALQKDAMVSYHVNEGANRDLCCIEIGINGACIRIFGEYNKES